MSTVVDIDRHRLVLGEYGIYNDSIYGSEIREGSITSDTGFVDLHLGANTGATYSVKLSSVITDNYSKAVGLRVNGNHEGHAHLSIEGDKANTFTGKLMVDGPRNIVDLRKKAGVRSIQGDAFVRGGAAINIWSDGQFSSTSKVSLEGGSILAISSENNKSTTQYLRLLSIGASGGVVQFNSLLSSSAKKYLYLDYLVIASGSYLDIVTWQEGIDYLLVRKDSQHLADALKKIRFQGYDPNAVHLESYNDEYWQIMGTPEPATYGAALVGAVSALVFWRRRRK